MPEAHPASPAVKFDREVWGRLIARGFSSGRHAGNPTQRCVMEALAAATGAGDTDYPPCVSPPLARLMQRAQDAGKLTTPQLADLAVLVVGTSDLDPVRVVFALADVCVREFVPALLDRGGLSAEATKLRALKSITDRRTAPAAAVVAWATAARATADAAAAAADAAAAAEAAVVADDDDTTASASVAADVALRMPDPPAALRRLIEAAIATRSPTT